ncbi:MAG: HPr family phosphocarrier protein [Deltaproteobacteria bacterium]|nr:HPr family phosphocarrier protein [Deltaproteobacteria bacterium]
MSVSDKELSREVIIVNELGLHARSAGKIAKLAQNAQSTIWLIKDNEKVDASSIIDILTLACEKGSKIMLTVDSKSDVHILNEITALVERGFEE